MSYEPLAGDLVWTDLNPSTGREQGGRRPCLIISEHSYWLATGFAIICPITTKVRPFPSSAVLPDTFPVTGEILTGQVRMIDARNRLFRFIGKAPPETLAEVRAKLAVLIGIE